MLDRSQVRFEEPTVWRVPLFRAFGDPDDHLRLIVLIASEFASTSDAGRVCMRPKEPWSARLDAIESVLRSAAQAAQGRTLGILSDVDALDPGRLTGKELWKDSQMRTQRAEFLERFLDAVDRGGWVLVRSFPGRSTDKRLAGVDVDAPPHPGDSVPAECAPMRAWLLDQGVLREPDLVRQVAVSGDDAPHEIMDILYDALQPSTRAAGRELAVLRPPMQMNGTVGPFSIAPDAVPRSALEELRAAGLLQRVGSGEFRMPRVARRCFLAHANLDEDRVLKVHRSLGEQDLDRQDISQQLETHFHAVQGGDLDDARRTALYYGTDLRELGVRLSRKRRWKQAAEVFRVILEDYDVDDAYAHEYWAYNRARELGPTMAATDAAEIAQAYSRAHKLADGSNPLFHGRWLGFQAEHGHDVRSEIDAGLARHLGPGADPVATSYFAEAVLKGLTRGRQAKPRADLLKRWGPRLGRAGVDPRLLTV